jgi:heme-binding protein
MKTTTVRHRLLGVLTATALGGVAAAALIGPPATAASNPCAASEVARTAGSVAKSTGDYLDSHPETNQAMTTILQQPAGPQSIASLKNYFGANPKVAGDLQALSQPLTGLSTQCNLPNTIPLVLGFMQATQGQGGLPGEPSGLPGAAAAAQPVTGTQGGAPAAPKPAPPPAPTGPLPGPAPAPQTTGG